MKSKITRYSFHDDDIMAEDYFEVEVCADSEYFQIIFGNELLELPTPTVLSAVRQVTHGD